MNRSDKRIRFTWWLGFIVLVTLLLVSVAYSAPNEPYQVKDILPGIDGSAPWNLTDFGGTLFFTADDGTHGKELWSSDGTELGTGLFKDINPGSGGAFAPSPTADAFLTDVEDSLYFQADDGTVGMELWKTDGTPEGTVLVKDIRPGWQGGEPAGLTPMGGELFFRASDGTFGYELWKSNGTPETTMLLKDIRTGSGSSYPYYLTDVNNILFFSATDGIHGTELWRSDGTPEGTFMVADIHSGASGSSPWWLVDVYGTLYFRADDGDHGNELWKSDGTEEGTQLVKDIFLGPEGSDLIFLMHINGTLYFSADDGEHGAELWKSDGTPEGTVMVRDIYPGELSSQPCWPVAINGALFFVANDGTQGNELWRSYGTEASTTLVRDVNPGGASGFVSTPLNAFLTPHGSALFFQAQDGTHGLELWQSLGTENSTVQIADIYPGSDSSDPVGMTVAGGILYFSADDGDDPLLGHGRELWAMQLLSLQRGVYLPLALR